MKKTNLTQINPNEKVTIDSNNIKGNNKHHLENLGFIKGNQITYLYPSLNKNPKAYLIKNTIIALRNEDAKNIIVIREDQNEKT
jgi:Fe2+ transport system protein FeoA